MQHSVKADYALRAIFDLSERHSGEPVRIAEIARSQQIPQKFLELILASLKQSGFVESRRGAEGGYLLARTPESITVGEVLRSVEGTQSSKRNIRRRAETPFTDLWQNVDSAVSGILDKVTFAQLVRDWNEKQNKFVMNWDI
jgi:Rrf2 family transcriptional regulator, cysteine metabolism repressor